MFQQLYDPHPALKGFVNNIMIHQVNFTAPGTPRKFSIPPLPEHGIIFYVRDRPTSENISTKVTRKLASSVIVGPQVHRHELTPGKEHLILKVGFQPGGLYRFLGIPMTELLDHDGIASEVLFGNSINEIHEQLAAADSFHEMKAVVENFLLRRAGKLKEEIPVDRVLPLIIKERGLIKVDQLASHACLSIRQFERAFQQRVGLSPKYFSRLVRFGHSWILKERNPYISWIKIAHECGYFDQMHFIRDFQEFAGATPSSMEPSQWQSPTKFFTRLFH